MSSSMKSNAIIISIFLLSSCDGFLSATRLQKGLKPQQTSDSLVRNKFNPFSFHTTGVVQKGLFAGLLQLVCVSTSLRFLAKLHWDPNPKWFRKALWTPSRTYDREGNSVGKEYDNWTKEGILEYYWGEHIHLGYYNDEERAKGYKKKNFVEAKYDFIDRMMEFGEIDKLVKPAAILDVGCGIGGTSRYLAKAFGSSTQVTGITLSQNQAARAAQLAKDKGISNVNFEVMDALNMTFPDDSFDVVWACESGEHMPDKKKYIEEMTRVLKPGGRLVVATWCQRDDEAQPFNSEERKMLDFLYSEWTHPFFISIKKYSELMSSLGFLRRISTADWTVPTLPSWRHSIWVGVFDPWPVLFRPHLWWKCLRDGVTLERMHRAFTSGLMQYGMMTATKLKQYVPPAP